MDAGLCAAARPTARQRMENVRCLTQRRRDRQRMIGPETFSPGPLAERGRAFSSSAPLRLWVIFFPLALIIFLCGARPARADVTAAQVNAAIESGVAYLEKQQRPEGRWSEYE